MIERNDLRVWIRLSDGSYSPFEEGLTHLEEVCKTSVLETPQITSPFCRQEILHHRAHLEFAGFRDRKISAHSYIYDRYMCRGDDALITLILVNRKDKNGISYAARRVEGYVILENPGSGEQIFGSYMRGRILYASLPEKGVFNVSTNTFFPESSS